VLSNQVYHFLVGDNFNLEAGDGVHLEISVANQDAKHHWDLGSTAGAPNIHLAELKTKSLTLEILASLAGSG
jgi:hypothetical protein